MKKMKINTDILSIVKVFDKIKQNKFKEIFIINEFSLRVNELFRF